MVIDPLDPAQSPLGYILRDGQRPALSHGGWRRPRGSCAGAERVAGTLSREALPGCYRKLGAGALLETPPGASRASINEGSIPGGRIFQQAR